MALLTFRFLQVAWRILTDQQDRMIAGHEAEEDLEALKAEMGDAADLMGGSRRDGKEQ